MIERNFVLALPQVEITQFVLGGANATIALRFGVKLKRCFEIRQSLARLAALQ
jgi:hypothetical protein